MAAPQQEPSGQELSIPVVLVHGIKDDGRKMRRLAAYLEGLGRATHCCDLLPNRGEVGLERLAEQLAAYIEKEVLAGQPAARQVDLVAFSMGGLVSRYYLQRLGGLKRTRRFITLATPHGGTWLAYLTNRPGCLQMRPSSPFLRDLDRDAETLREVGFTSIWSPLDLVILPATNSVVPHARCEKVWCLAHPLLVSDAASFRKVAQALK
ncbi:MAG TPA: hypothetical protein VNQ90_06945 [Chthoniobacteraceae bacterium]|nr:hypothetical protein [Chthoniobacteraceae bacterium]